MKRHMWKRMAALMLAAVLSVVSAMPVFARIGYIDGISEGWDFLQEAYAARQRPITDAECQQIMTNLLSLQGELAEAGIYFVVFIAPDKEEIYGDMLPAGYPLAGQDPIDQLVDYLHTNAPELPVIYSKALLKSAREAGVLDGASLYYANDSHWNLVGGYVAAGELIRAIGEHFGHEDAMIEHTFTLLPDSDAGNVRPEYIYQDEPLAELTKTIISRQNNDWIYSYYFSTVPGCWPEKLYFTGDSFRFSPMKVLAERFKSSVCANRYYLDLENVAVEDPDVFVFSAVGRYARSALSEMAGFNTSALPLTNVITIYAEDHWVKDQRGYWWRNGDGTYPVNTWMWLDGNKDGIYENYYFDSDGYCLLNTVTPDGYTVNENGAWVVDGVVQTQTGAP